MEALQTATMFYNNGEYKNAQDTLRTSLATMTLDNAYRFDTLNTLGCSLFARKEYQEAKDVFLDALEHTSSADQYDIVNGKCNLAWSYIQLGELDNAYAIAEEALVDAEHDKLSGRLALNIKNITGTILFYKQEYTEATELYQEVLKQATDPEDRSAHMATRTLASIFERQEGTQNLADVYKMRSQRCKAATLKYKEMSKNRNHLVVCMDCLKNEIFTQEEDANWCTLVILCPDCSAGGSGEGSFGATLPEQDMLRILNLVAPEMQQKFIHSDRIVRSLEGVVHHFIKDNCGLKIRGFGEMSSLVTKLLGDKILTRPPGDNKLPPIRYFVSAPREKQYLFQAFHRLNSRKICCQRLEDGRRPIEEYWALQEEYKKQQNFLF